MSSLKPLALSILFSTLRDEREVQISLALPTCLFQISIVELGTQKVVRICSAPFIHVVTC
jgi:hypothetical protein